MRNCVIGGVLITSIHMCFITLLNGVWDLDPTRTKPRKKKEQRRGFYGHKCMMGFNTSLSLTWKLKFGMLQACWVQAQYSFHFCVIRPVGCLEKRLYHLGQRSARAHFTSFYHFYCQMPIDALYPLSPSKKKSMLGMWWCNLKKHLPRVSFNSPAQTEIDIHYLLQLWSVRRSSCLACF